MENISNISPGQVAYLIWSFGKLSKLLLPYVINMKVLILLCHEYLKKNIAKMHAQNVGILAHGLAMIPLDKMRERVDVGGFVRDCRGGYWGLPWDEGAMDCG